MKNLITKNKKVSSLQKKEKKIINQYGFFLLLLICMMVASIQPNLAKSNGLLNGKLIVWYFAIPLTYLEAGVLCNPTSLYVVLTDCYLLSFVMFFTYVLMPFLVKLGTFTLTFANVNIWLLKGMEVLYCMPPPFGTSLVLCQLAKADLPTGVITTLLSHFGGLLISPILLYFVLGASTPLLVGINLKEILYCTLLPLATGILLQPHITFLTSRISIEKGWFSKGLLLITAFHLFCDAISVDASSLQAIDILLCVLIACVGQVLVYYLCWMLCSRWLPRKVLLAALFASTHKSVSLGGWLLRGAYHGSAHGPAVNLPLSILPVAQLLLGSLLASWLTPSTRHQTFEAIT